MSLQEPANKCQAWCQMDLYKFHFLDFTFKLKALDPSFLAGFPANWTSETTVVDMETFRRQYPHRDCQATLIS